MIDERYFLHPRTKKSNRKMAAAVAMLTAMNTSAAAAARAEKEKLKEEEDIPRTCRSCGVALDKPLGCGYCKRATYCSHKCQKKQWKWHKHKGECCSMWPTSVVAAEISAAYDLIEKKKDGFCCSEADLAAIGINISNFPEIRSKRLIYPLLPSDRPFASVPQIDKFFSSDPHRPVPMFGLEYKELSAGAKYAADSEPVGMIPKGLVLVEYPKRSRRGGEDGFELARDHLMKNPKKADLLAKSVRRRLYGISPSVFPVVPKAM